MKSVGLLIPTLGKGGAERVASRLSYILSKSYKVYVIVFDGANNLYGHGGELIDMQTKAYPKNPLKALLLPVRRAIILKGIVKQKQVDVVISFMDSPNLVNVLLKVKGCRRIVSVRNYHLFDETRTKRWLRSWIYKRADKVVSVSKALTNIMGVHYGVKEENGVTIYNPYNVKSIGELAKEPLEDFMTPFFNNHRIIINVGRYNHQKGQKRLLEVFSILEKSDPELGLVLIGEGKLKEELKALSVKLNMADKVLFLPFQTNPFKYIYNSEIYVLSSYFEGFPNALVEAMACGTAVVSTACPTGPDEILTKEVKPSSVKGVYNGEYGVLVEGSQDFETCMVEGIKSLLYDVQKKETYEILGKERCKVFNERMCLNSWSKLIN